MIRREFNPKFVIFRDPEIFHILDQLKPGVRTLFIAAHAAGESRATPGSKSSRITTTVTTTTTVVTIVNSGIDRPNERYILHDSVVIDDDTVLEDVGLSVKEIDVEIEEAADAEDDIVMQGAFSSGDLRGGRAVIHAYEF
ncbi:hypothetical protein BDV34DRAFT_219666 [Aspergillus parasiticus]|uniref:Uncharacterized protein n=1 Tax=Aspergillus parasiticus TaxID=5067 RepID=A0A5N6E3D6_ASPPA|nr:hypothetical protein BDV34DRAFT_219666 [Aspergillus parasiticus]